MSPTDLRSARVYVSVLGTDEEREDDTGGAAVGGGIHPSSSQAATAHAANSRTGISG